MRTVSEKLNRLNRRYDSGQKINIGILGLGSVGNYLLSFLLNDLDDRFNIVVIGRSYEKLVSDVNIHKIGCGIRNHVGASVEIRSGVDFSNEQQLMESVKDLDILVNSSRAYPGLKYGSISWSKFRAYGIWTPLSMKLSKRIISAVDKVNEYCMTINTSYSDAVIPWMKSNGGPYFDFGSGNLNHLVPRMKFSLMKTLGLGLNEYKDLELELVCSHFHDVCISKEGQDDGVKIGIYASFGGEELKFDYDELLKSCSIPMPTDQKRNIMNASSNYSLIKGIIDLIKDKNPNYESTTYHSPGLTGLIGGYPFKFCRTDGDCNLELSRNWSFDKMTEINKKSIYLDGIESIENGVLTYTNELIKKVYDSYEVNIPKNVKFEESDEVADLLINKIISVSV